MRSERVVIVALASTLLVVPGVLANSGRNDGGYAASVDRFARRIFMIDVSEQVPTYRSIRATASASAKPWTGRAPCNPLCTSVLCANCRGVRPEKGVENAGLFDKQINLLALAFEFRLAEYNLLEAVRCPPERRTAC